MANFNVTIAGNRISPLITNERDSGGSTVRYIVTSGDIALASATGNADTITMTLGTTPTNWVASSCYAYVQTAFAGTTALTMQVGTTSSTACFLASTSILTAGIIQPSGGINTVNTVGSAKGTASVTMQALFTNATGGSPSALTAGYLIVLLALTDLDAFY